MAMRMGPALGSPTIVMLAAVPGILGGFPAARPHWRCRANVWRGRTSPAGGPRRLMAHDGSSHLLDLRLGICRPRQRCAADQRWPVLRPVLREARRSRTGATDTRERRQARRQRRGAAMTSGIIALILDFAAGYGVREWISAADAKRRRIGGMLGVQTRPRTSRAPADSSAAIRYPAGPVWPVRDR